jgi:hypothetical protein
LRCLPIGTVRRTLHQLLELQINLELERHVLLQTQVWEPLLEPLKGAEVPEMADALLITFIAVTPAPARPDVGIDFGHY